MGDGGFDHDLRREAADCVGRVVQAQRDAGDAGVLDAQRQQRRAHHVHFGVGVGAEACAVVLQAGGGRLGRGPGRGCPLPRRIAVDARRARQHADQLVIRAGGQVKVARRANGEGHALVGPGLFPGNLHARRDQGQAGRRSDVHTIKACVEVTQVRVIRRDFHVPTLVVIDRDRGVRGVQRQHVVNIAEHAIAHVQCDGRRDDIIQGDHRAVARQQWRRQRDTQGRVGVFRGRGRFTAVHRHVGDRHLAARGVGEEPQIHLLQLFVLRIGVADLLAAGDVRHVRRDVQVDVVNAGVGEARQDLLLPLHQARAVDGPVIPGWSFRRCGGRPRRGRKPGRLDRRRRRRRGRLRRCRERPRGLGRLRRNRAGWRRRSACGQGQQRQDREQTIDSFHRLSLPRRLGIRPCVFTSTCESSREQPACQGRVMEFADFGVLTNFLNRCIVMLPVTLPVTCP